MARIEISMGEYNALKTKIQLLERENVEISKQAAAYKEKLEKIKYFLMDIQNSSLIERTWHWKKAKREVGKAIEDLTQITPS